MFSLYQCCWYTEFRFSQVESEDLEYDPYLAFLYTSIKGTPKKSFIYFMKRMRIDLDCMLLWIVEMKSTMKTWNNESSKKRAH